MLEDLRAFVAVIDEKSLTRAAKKIFLTQSAISRRIQQLEDKLEAKLLDRASRPPTSTALGNRVYERAVPILRAVDLLAALPREDAAPSGTLRLGVSQAIGDVILSDAVQRLKTEFPSLDVRLRAAPSPGLLQDVNSGHLDAAVVFLSPASRPADRIVGKRLALLDVVVVQSRQRPRFRRQIRVSTLANEDWILNPEGCKYRSALERAIGERGGTLRVIVDTHGIEVQLRMIASGLGLGLVPRSILSASPSRRDLSVVDVADFALNLDLWLAHLAELGNLRSAVDAFGEVVAKIFQHYDRKAARRRASLI
jgi:DNA-binding transcriptional LysR family regulator